MEFVMTVQKPVQKPLTIFEHQAYHVLKERPDLSVHDLVHMMERDALKALMQMPKASSPEDWDYLAEIWFNSVILLFSFKWNQ
jgi:hypothetical protein